MENKKIAGIILATIGLIVFVVLVGVVGTSNYKKHIAEMRYKAIKTATGKWQANDCTYFYETTVRYRSGTSVADAEMATLYDIIYENCEKNRKTPH